MRAVDLQSTEKVDESHNISPIRRKRAFHAKKDIRICTSVHASPKPLLQLQNATGTDSAVFREIKRLYESIPRGEGGVPLDRYKSSFSGSRGLVEAFSLLCKAELGWKQCQVVHIMEAIVKAYLYHGGKSLFRPPLIIQNLYTTQKYNRQGRKPKIEKWKCSKIPQAKYWMCKYHEGCQEWAVCELPEKRVDANACRGFGTARAAP